MRVTIIGAMDEEIRLLQDTMENAITERLHHLDVICGTIHNHEVQLVRCGIGKVAATVATALLIDKYVPQLVINTGSAGGSDKQLKIGDIVVADSLIHHDVDVTHFNYALGQVPSMPEQFVTDTQYSTLAIEAAKDLEQVTVIQGLICSGDAFIGSDEKAATILSLFPQMKAVEMEAAAIAQTCFMLDCPCVVIRSLSDIAGKESTVSFEQYLQTAAKNSANLVVKMLSKLTH